MDQRKMIHLMKVYKKQVFVGILTISATMILLISLAIFGAYKLIMAPRQEPIATIANDEKQIPTLHPTSSIGGIAMSLVQGFLSESLKTQEMNEFVDGLACVDAIGGPSPDIMLQHLKARISDDMLQSKLTKLENQLANQMHSRGTESCVSWFMGG